MSGEESRSAVSGSGIWATMSGDERQKACLDGRKAGHSSAHTAALVGASRNSVIGYLKRMKDRGVRVPASLHGKGRNKVQTDKAQSPAQKTRQQPSRFNAGALVTEIRHRLNAEPHVVVSRERAFDPLPGSVPISLMECGPLTCRWAVDGLHGPGRLFCGRPKQPEVSYCASHARLAYQPASERRRRDSIATATMAKAA